jgi:uncharacterized protein YgiB involved in biofilm formation
MKKSKHVILAHMKKDWRNFVYTPMTFAIAGIALSGCGDDEQNMVIYKSVDDCINANPGYSAECKAAYQTAVEDAARTAPKYNSLNDCIAEFGVDMCRAAPQHSNWFMPAMTGFMFARLLDGGDRRYYSQPMFSSSYPNSRYYGRWTTADGRDYGSSQYRSSKVRVRSDHLKPKPTVSRTISRGGFGSTVSAKSSWGSSRSRGWGG